MLLGENACGKGCRCVIVVYRYYALHNDGAAIERFVNEMNCAATPFDTVLDCLALRV